MTVNSVEDFAPNSQPKNSQNPQCWQLLRPWYGCDAIAIGAGKGCQPSRFAPRSNSTPDDFTGSGGIGYGLERGGADGPPPAPPGTPVSPFTFVLYGPTPPPGPALWQSHRRLRRSRR